MKILIYPWFSYNNRNLLKYINLYKDLYGKNTIVDVIKYKKLDVISYNRWQKIRSGYLYNRNLLNSYDCIHMISGGSIIAYNQLNFYKNINSEKFIFDSGPFFPSPYESARFICNYLPALNKYNVNNLEKVLLPLYKLEGYDNEEEILYRKWLLKCKNNLLLYNKK